MNLWLFFICWSSTINCLCLILNISSCVKKREKPELSSTFYKRYFTLILEGKLDWSIHDSLRISSQLHYIISLISTLIFEFQFLGFKDWLIQMKGLIFPLYQLILEVNLSENWCNYHLVSNWLFGLTFSDLVNKIKPILVEKLYEWMCTCLRINQAEPL